jgi:hypothetical protein
MNETRKPTFPAGKESLWTLIAGPLIWTMHFLASYVSAAVWCAKYEGPEGTLEPVRWLVGGYTLVALIGIAVAFVLALRRQRRGDAAAMPDDNGSDAARHRFLGLATLMLASLSAVATFYVGAVVIFIGSCR